MKVGLPAAANTNIGAVENNVKAGNLDEAQKVAQEFETLFVNMMLQSMRNAVKSEDGSNARDIYQGMLDTEYSKSMAENTNFGIRNMIVEWLKQNDPTLASLQNPEAYLLQQKNTAVQAYTQLGKLR